MTYKEFKYLKKNRIIERETTNDVMKFHKKIDPGFLDLLCDLYDPFLSPLYKNAEIQYTVTIDKKPICLIALLKNKQNMWCLELAFVPDEAGKGKSISVIKKVMELENINEVQWTVDRNNLPSLKLLKKLGGGVTFRGMDKSPQGMVRGFFSNIQPICNSSKKALDLLIEKAKHDYNKWKLEYEKRHKELKKLNDYLNNVLKIN